MDQLTVLDIFCGAGGFSEGFRQQGFKIERGVDKWQPAIETFNFNFETNSIAQDVLEFAKSVEPIEFLPDTDVILGSPPCVTFSSSNNSGKADKESGIELTKAFLRIVAVKKHKAGSKLRAWFMENVPRSTKHLPAQYSFRDLGLEDWAIERELNPEMVAVTLDGFREVINSADYGCPQTRERAITGEIIGHGFIVPTPTHSKKSSLGRLPWRTIEQTIRTLPDPSAPPSEKAMVTDPNYSEISIKHKALSDHFYDTGLYECEWELSRYLKTNHPYMGKMAFPEEDARPSRTVTATKIGSSREALIYYSGYNRTGDGQYRTPTVREAASLMGFPITYQFLGSENTKWRLVGNAVCPSVSRAFARELQRCLDIKPRKSLEVRRNVEILPKDNLNTFTKKSFDNPPLRNKNSRFRRHPFKDGRMTVTLSNYDIEGKGKDVSRWLTSVQYGTGDGRPAFPIPDGMYRQMEAALREFSCGENFIQRVEQEIVSRTAKSDTLQKLYEKRISNNGYLEPSLLIDELGQIIESLKFDRPVYVQGDMQFFPEKHTVPPKQLFALYGINKIATIANNGGTCHNAGHSENEALNS